MGSPSQFAQVAMLIVMAIVCRTAAAQSGTVPAARGQMKQEELCCVTNAFVNPVYPREARLAGIQGQVKLLLVIGLHNEVAELHAVSGNPLLVEAAMTAMRQWKFSFGGYVGGPRETEVPITYIFKLEVPQPGYLRLKAGYSIREDSVREYTDHMEYTAHGRTHDIDPESVASIDWCDLGKRTCIPGGGPQFVIRALPLLPSPNGKNTAHPVPDGSSSQ